VSSPDISSPERSSASDVVIVAPLLPCVRTDGLGGKDRSDQENGSIPMLPTERTSTGVTYLTATSDQGSERLRLVSS
jgi:hypothetical protein